MRKFISEKFYVIVIFCLLFNHSFSQQAAAGNDHNNNDTIFLSEYAQLQRDFSEINRDSALYYGYKALAVSKKLNQNITRVLFYVTLLILF